MRRVPQVKHYTLLLCFSRAFGGSLARSLARIIGLTLWVPEVDSGVQYCTSDCHYMALGIIYYYSWIQVCTTQ